MPEAAAQYVFIEPAGKPVIAPEATNDPVLRLYLYILPLFKKQFRYL